MRICIYGASSNEIDNIYKEKVYDLGKKMAERNMDLVYGGGAQGLMGAAARGVRENGGQVLGVAPDFFQVDGVLYDKCTEFIYTKTMRERKQVMEDSADAFIMTPGGCGTFEEFFEILTLKQLERHTKAIAIFNIQGYYDKLIGLMENAIAGKFMKPANRMLYKVFDDAEQLLDYIVNYVPVQVELKNLRHVDEAINPFVYDIQKKKEV